MIATKIQKNNKSGFTRTLNFSKRRSLVCGFTLIELMVAISIFMMVMIMAMGSVLVASDVSKKADKLRTAMDNVNFAMESMTRSIRMGTNYMCGSPVGDYGGINYNWECSNGGTFISFKPQPSQGTYVSYQISNGIVYRYSSGVTVPIVSPDVHIDILKFFVKGPRVSGTPRQASVYIIMKGTVNIKGESHSFALQTMASQRNLELVP